MNELCEMVFILDRSGSMHGLESDTIGGFNSMIEKQQKDSVKGMATVALFNDKLSIPFERIDLKEVPEMTDKLYYTGGTTALFDAVGTMILKIRNHRRHLSDAEIPSKTVFVITTDGYENASTEFSGEALKRMIEEQREAGWEFLYLGANVDAVAEARKIGIRAERAVRYHADSEGTRVNYMTIGRTLSDYANSPCQEESIPDDWADNIRKDFKSRKSSR